MTDRPRSRSAAATRLHPGRVTRIIAWAAAAVAATAAGMARLASADEPAPKPEPVVTTVTTSLVRAAPLPKAPAKGLVVIRHEEPKAPTSERADSEESITPAPAPAPAPTPVPAPAPAPAPSTQSSGS